jgi:outer membrane beta-barrel protein
MKTTSSSKARFAIFLAGAAAVLVTALPQVAHAQRRSPLADAPAIRKRLELRDTRIEIGVGWTSTVGQDYYHSQLLGGRLAFHFTDWLSIGVLGGFGLVQLETAYNERLIQSLPATEAERTVAREPLKSEATAALEHIKWMAAAQLEFTPFTGKYSLFGKIFAHYDFYAAAGAGAIGVAPAGTVGACSDATTTGANMPIRACGLSGPRPGPTVALGLHTFFNQFLALNVELRDFITQVNPSGRDVNADLGASNADTSWQSTFMVTGNLMLYFPTVAAISQ